MYYIGIDYRYEGYTVHCSLVRVKDTQNVIILEDCGSDNLIYIHGTSILSVPSLCASSHFTRVVCVDTITARTASTRESHDL